MTAALVDLEVELGRVKDDREPTARALRSREQLDGLFREWLGARGEGETTDVLVTGSLPATA